MNWKNEMKNQSNKWGTGPRSLKLMLQTQITQFFLSQDLYYIKILHVHFLES